MASINVPFEHHHPYRMGATVSADEDTVTLALALDTPDGVELYLSPGEARALAAALVHFADQVAR